MVGNAADTHKALSWNKMNRVMETVIERPAMTHGSISCMCKHTVAVLFQLFINGNGTEKRASPQVA